MKSIQTTIGAFKKALKTVVTATGSKVANIVIDDKGLHVEAATTEGFACVKVPFDKHNAESCSAGISQSMISSILGNEVPDTLLSLTKTDAGLRLRFSGANLQMKRAEVEPSEMFNQSYQDMNRVKIAVTTGAEIREAIMGAVRHMAVRDVRYYLCGLHIKSVNDELVFTGTNGFALHQKQSKIRIESLQEAIDMILPGSAAHAAAAIFDSDTVVNIHKVGENLIGFSTADFYWVSNLISGNYPETAVLLEKEITMKRMMAGQFVVPKKDLLNAITRITAVSEKDGRYCRMTFEGDCLTVSSVDDQQIQKIDLEVIHSGINAPSEETSLKVGVSSAVFYEALDSVPTDHVHLLRDQDASFAFFMRPVIKKEEGNVVSDNWVSMVLPARI